MLNVLFLAAYPADAEKLASVSKHLWLLDCILDNKELLPRLSQYTYDFLLFDFEAGSTYPPDILKKISTDYPAIPIFLLSRQHCFFIEKKAASSATIAGSFELPYNFDALHTAIQNILRSKPEQQDHISAELMQNSPLYTKLQGQSYAIQEVRNFILNVAKQSGHVLLSGESGSGKEVVSSLIHHYSENSTGAYITVNASCIPEGVAESLLFGSCKGAYTGAVDKEGLFSSAHKGTLFLDEIENLSLDLQGKLLRVLEHREYYKLGGSKKYYSDFRLICATNCDLPTLIHEKRFRLDLYYRLDVFHITLPPLREHKEDIELLARSYLKKVNKHLSDKALLLLKEHSWPGNIRELFNCLDRAVFLAKEAEVVLPQHLDI